MPADNVAEVQLSADVSRLAAGLRAAARMVNDFGSGANAAMSRFHLAPREVGRGKSWLAHTGGQLLGRTAARGMDFFIEQGKAVLDFEENLTRLGIAGRETTTKLNAIRQAAKGSSEAFGVDRKVVLDSYRAYIDLAGAQHGSIKKMELLAKAGQATGAEGKDLAGMMYQLTRSMKVTDDQMEDTIGGLVNQAKDGAIEAKQMAAEFAGMMPIFARFGVTGREGAIQLGAAYQITRDGFDSASQAATGMIRLMAGFQRHASRFRDWGVQVFKPGSKKDLRELGDIMDQVKRSPLSKDIQALIKSFGRSEAWRTFELLNEAPDRMRQLVAAGRENNVLNKDMATYASSTAGRMAIAMERMKNAVAEAFTPERVEQFAKAIEAIAVVVNKIAEGVGFVATKIERMTRGTEMDAEERVKKEVEGLSKMSESDRNHRILSMSKRASEIDAGINSRSGMEGRMDDGFMAGVYKHITPNMIAEANNWRLHSVGTYTDPWAVNNVPREKFKDPQDQKFADANREWAERQLPKDMVKVLAQLAGSLKEFVADNKRPTVVNVDGNPVARAGKNATDLRRK
jgi:hypothetical protein